MYLDDYAFRKSLHEMISLIFKKYFNKIDCYR